MKICMVEACSAGDRGSIGAWYVAQAATRAGHEVAFEINTKKGYDIELISVHHCDDFPRLAAMPKRAKIRIVGGHPMQNNPRPCIPFADIICIGEGESWIVKVLDILRDDFRPEAVAHIPGTIVSKLHQDGQEIAEPNYEKPLPENPPYLNRPGTRSAAWYIEMARGCPFSCAYCELGNSSPFRLYSAEKLKATIDKADTKITRKINFYAPDEASHPDYNELLDYLRTKGFAASFSSMRIDSVLRTRPNVLRNALIRVGVDGLTEATRRRVGKNISDSMIHEYFHMFAEAGHVQFKMFMIFGYPWETLSDFDQFEGMMEGILRMPIKKNISLRIKWTPFIPQPCTPLGNTTPQYDFDMVNRINVWHALNARPRREPGIFVENDGLMSAKSHARQIRLTIGNEAVLLGEYSPIAKA